MRNTVEKNYRLRTNRAIRVRKKLHGSKTKPRLCVVKSNKHIRVQLIDDDAGVTLGSTSTLSPKHRTGNLCCNKTSGRKLGEEIAQIAKDVNVVEVVFDRGASKYHGVLAELADAARAGGLKF